MRKYYLFLTVILIAVLFAACGKLAATTQPVVGMRGVNLMGGEMDWKSGLVPVSGSNYLFVSHSDIDYLASKNVNFVRLLFSWEAVQPNGINTTIGGNAYTTTFFDVVNYATSKGLYVMIEPHGGSSPNFARYKGNLVGSAAVPNDAFANLWGQLATTFKGNTRVGYGLSNEPNSIGTSQWFASAEAAILAIRNAGVTTTVFVPGNGWTASGSWTSNWYDTSGAGVSNAAAWKAYINDPGNNVAMSVHMYFDANAGGTGTDVVSPTIGVERVKTSLDWARANGVKLHLGEFACAASNANCATAIDNMMVYLNANSDIVVGYNFWGYGVSSWWGSYQFTLSPNGSTDSPQMKLLSKYLVPGLVVVPPVIVPTVVVPPVVVDASVVVVDAGVKDAGVVVADAGVVIKDAGTEAGVVDAGTPQSNFTTSVNRYNSWTGGYCVEITITNVAKVNLAWHTLSVDMNGGSLRDYWLGATKSTWGAKGVVVFTPAVSPSNQWLAAGKFTKVGFCSDNSNAAKTAFVVSLL